MTNQATLLAVRQAAELLGVSPSTLRKWDESGRLVATRNLGNGYRMYRSEDVLALRAQMALFPDRPSPSIEVEHKAADPAALRRTIRSLHRVIRDREASSSIVERFDELTKMLYCTAFAQRAAQLVPIAASPAARTKLLFTALVAATPHYFPERFRRINLKDETIEHLDSILSSITLADASIDLKGLAYEELVRNTFDKGDNQQFFTPQTLVEFLVDLIGDRLQGSICDPACGTGGFLLAAHRRLPADRRRRSKLFGFEIDERLAWATRMNLAMHGVPGFTVSHVTSPGGSLDSPTLKDAAPFDVIITNPPFGSDVSDDHVLQQYSLGEQRSSRRRGILFIERCLRLLKPGGLLGIVIDDGVITAPGTADVRRFIREHSNVLAVASLPDTSFMPYASVKASILLLERQDSRSMSTNRVFFAEAEKIGRRPNGDPLYKDVGINGVRVLDSDLDELVGSWRSGPQSSVSDTGSNAHHYWATGLGPDPESRLDFAFRHPAVGAAAAALRISNYPVRSLGLICQVRNETIVPTLALSDEEFQYVGLANMEAYNGRCEPTLATGASIKSAVKRFCAGDILFSKMRPELRKVWLVPPDIDEGFASSECIVLTPHSKVEFRVEPELLAALLRTDLIYGQLLGQVSGIGRPRVGVASILGLSIPVPPINIQRGLLEKYRGAEFGVAALQDQAKSCLTDADRLLEAARKSLGAGMLGINPIPHQ